MKKILLVIFLLTVPNLYSQWFARSGMGLNVTNISSLRDYLNDNVAPSNNQVAAFNSAIEFSGEIGYEVKENLQIALDLSYEISSFNYFLTANYFELTYEFLMPSIMAYHLVKGEGYIFRFGGGVGPRFTSVDEKGLVSNRVINYKSTGVGFLLRADGSTKLSQFFYANIGGDIRYNNNGNPKNDGVEKNINARGDKLNMNSLSVGLRLGITYLF